jgi:hypothetical protein
MMKLVVNSLPLDTTMKLEKTNLTLHYDPTYCNA